MTTRGNDNLKNTTSIYNEVALATAANSIEESPISGYSVGVYMSDYIPILLLLGVVVSFVGITIAITHVLGPHRASRVKDAPFECGIDSQENARVPFSVKYFLIAILFVLFDVEVVFFYPWAVQFKELGMLGFIEMGLFMAMFCVGLAYLMKHNVFDFLKD